MAIAETNFLIGSHKEGKKGISRVFDRILNLIFPSGCDTRDVVLKRDGTGVVQDDSCSASSGKWYSPYDGASWTAASDLDIDHVVPLSNAWKVSYFVP